MARTRFLIDGSEKSLLSSTVTLQGDRGVDQGVFHILPCTNAETNCDIEYLQDIANLTNLKTFYPYDNNLGDESGGDHHGTGFDNIPVATSHFKFECNLNDDGCANSTATVQCGCATYTCGKVGCKAFCFDGTRYITLNQECKYDFKEYHKFSFAFWFKGTGSGTQIQFAKGTGAPWIFLNIHDCGCCDVIRFGLVNTSGCPGNRINIDSSVGNYRDDAWHHFALSYDGSTNAKGVRMYIDGELNQPTINNDSLTASPLNNCNFAIGARSNGTNNWSGQLDDFYIFHHKELTQDEVSRLFHEGSLSYNKCGKWGKSLSFDGCKGFYEAGHCSPTLNSCCNLIAHIPFNGTANDIAGCNCGTVTGCITYTCGIVLENLAGCFDGTNDYVTLANECNFDFDRLCAWTTSAWIRGSTACGNESIIRKYCGGSTPSVHHMVIGDGTCSNDKVQVEIIADTTGCCGIIVRADNINIRNGEWHHIVTSYNGSGCASGVKIYFDGTQQCTVTAQDNLCCSVLNNIPVTIGARNNGSDKFTGRIDDVRIYNKALSACEVKDIYDFTRRCDYKLCGQFEILWWMKAANSCSVRTVWHKTDGCQGLDFKVNACCKPVFRFGSNTITGTTDVADCNWHQIRVRRDSCNLLSMFVCNSSEGCAVSCATCDETNLVPLTFGRNECNGEYYDGEIDSFRWYKGTLNTGDICNLYTKKNPISIMKFGGKVTKVNKEISKKEVIAQSFGKSLSETEVRPKSYDCKSPEFIIEDLIKDNTCYIVNPYPACSGITISTYLADGKLFDVICDLISLMGATFRTSSLQVFDYEPKSFTVKSNTFTHGCDTRIWETKFDDTELVNELTVIGENKRYQTEEFFSGDGSTKCFTLTENAVSIQVEHPVCTILTPETCYSLCTTGKVLTFCCAPACGCCNIKTSYEYEIPLTIKGDKPDSIACNGIHAKRLILPWIKTRNDGVRFIESYLNRYSSVRQNLAIDHPALLTSLRENDVIRAVNSIKRINNTFVIKSLQFKYPEFTTVLQVGEYTFDDFEYDKQIAQKIHDLEGAVTTVKTLRDFENPQETLSICDSFNINAHVQVPAECLCIVDTGLSQMRFKAYYGLAQYSTDDVYAGCNSPE